MIFHENYEEYIVEVAKHNESFYTLVVPFIGFGVAGFILLYTLVKAIIT